jgi:hypothetical protein
MVFDGGKGKRIFEISNIRPNKNRIANTLFQIPNRNSRCRIFVIRDIKGAEPGSVVKMAARDVSQKNNSGAMVRIELDIPICYTKQYEIH